MIPLTPRQKELAALVSQGYTNAAIAAKLVVRENTVGAMLTRIYDRLGLPNDKDRRVLLAIIWDRGCHLEVSV